MLAADDFLFGPRSSIFERFKDIPAPGGLRMYQTLVKYYALPKHIGCRAFWYSGGKGVIDKHPTFVLHEWNVREQDVVVEDYMDPSVVVRLPVRIKPTKTIRIA